MHTITLNFPPLDPDDSSYLYELIRACLNTKTHLTAISDDHHEEADIRSLIEFLDREIMKLIVTYIGEMGKTKSKANARSRIESTDDPYSDPSSPPINDDLPN